MTELYEKMASAPVSPDLVKIWQELGIGDGPNGAHFDDQASMAAIRRAMTMPLVKATGAN